MKPKQRCPECRRMLRINKLVYNPVKKVDLCKNCDKKVGHNLFYTPPEKRKYRIPIVSRISKYNFQDDEKKVLMNNLKNEGLTFEEANNRIKEDITFMKSRKKLHSSEFEEKKQAQDKIKRDKATKEKLIEGLKGK
jgi:hypothetical protein